MKNPSNLLATTLALALLGALGLGAASCRRADLAYCDKSCSCTGCSETEKRDCEDFVDDTRKDAETKGCTAIYDTYASCLNAEFECTNGTVTTDGCNAELTDLLTCAL